MTDHEIIQQINEHLDTGKAMSISYMRDGLEICLRELERLQQPHKELKTGLPKLSTKQAAAFDFIVAYVAQHGYSPSVRDVQVGLGYQSSSTPYALLQKLDKKGYIKLNGKRGLIILAKGSEGNQTSRD